VGVFSEHVLEHFDLAQGQALLRECFRVLRIGGVLRVVVPDGETILKAYLEEPTALISRRGSKIQFPMDAVNSYFRQRYEHQYIYDWPLLQSVLREVGFVTAERVAYKTAAASQKIVLDDKKYAWESLYVEAVKEVIPEIKTGKRVRS
jgi:predicted SAM-dependent methyltransferase